MTTPTILAIDQGTTSSRAILFDQGGTVLRTAQRALPQIYPGHGWVEHDPEVIWADTLATCREVLDGANPAVLGITNQRETTVVWDRRTGRPIHNAIVWQDRRTAARCAALVASGHEPMVTARSGLVIDPYFSASKIAWIIEHTHTRDAAARGDLAFGTIDCFLLWRLTGGRVHATDAANAARTGLYNIHTGTWDPALLDLYGIHPALLPDVTDNAAAFGTTEPGLLPHAVAIGAMAGDQQAALVGHACFAPGDVKCTYGTGAFMIANTGPTPIASHNRLLTTVGYRLNGVTTYALEGGIFVTGAAIQWLRDGLGLLQRASDSSAIAASVADSAGVYVVPALTGLGAPYWDAGARGLICGMDRGATAAHIVRATLEAVCYQTADLIEAMRRDGNPDMPALRVDGGMTSNDWLMQRMADLTRLPVERAAVMETTALGVACLAGLEAGLFGSLTDIAGRRSPDRIWQPTGTVADRDTLYAGWTAAVQRARS